MKMEQKKIHRPEWELQVKQEMDAPFMASPVCIGQAQVGEETNV